MVPLEPLALDSLSLMTDPPTNNTETTVQQPLQKYFQMISTPTPRDNTGQVYDSAVVNIESAPETSLLASSPCKDTPTPHTDLATQSVQPRIDDVLASEDANLPFGDDISGTKSPETLRFFFQNANSIRSERMEKWLHTCVCMRAKEVDIFGLAEINVNPRHPGLAEDVTQIAKRNWTHATTTLANTDADC